MALILMEQIIVLFLMMGCGCISEQTCDWPEGSGWDGISAPYRCRHCETEWGRLYRICKRWTENQKGR